MPTHDLSRSGARPAGGDLVPAGARVLTRRKQQQ